MGEGGCKPDEGSTSIIYALSFVGHVCPTYNLKIVLGKKAQLTILIGKTLRLSILQL